MELSTGSSFKASRKALSSYRAPSSFFACFREVGGRLFSSPLPFSEVFPIDVLDRAVAAPEQEVPPPPPPRPLDWAERAVEGGKGAAEAERRGGGEPSSSAWPPFPRAERGVDPGPPLL